MIDFRTWWRLRDGKEMTITLGIILAIVLSIVIFYDPEEKDPDICTNLCIIDKNGIPRYQEWFREHPEDKPIKKGP